MFCFKSRVKKFMKTLTFGFFSLASLGSEKLVLFDFTSGLFSWSDVDDEILILYNLQRLATSLVNFSSCLNIASCLKYNFSISSLDNSRLFDDVCVGNELDPDVVVVVVVTHLTKNKFKHELLTGLLTLNQTLHLFTNSGVWTFISFETK